MSIEHVAPYLDGGIKKVQGWCIPQLWNVIQPLHEYQENAGITGPIAEIGVFHGKFFIGLALTKKGQGKHTAFDVFDLQHFNLDGAGKGNLEAFTANLRQFDLPEDETEIRRVDSMALTRRDIAEIRAQRGAFSMFSVDGCHMVEHTINDFRIAMELTQPGGIIYVDDYLNPDWPGVQEGLARLYLNDAPRFVPIAYTCNKLFTCHISYARDMFDHLRETVRASFPNCQVKVVKRFGYDCLNVKPDYTGPSVRL
ncbi:class I SAM-dependent methyltransferase [Microbaculum marinum]|uniref:Class I SAM-dependent methyltransferase n=1 Tax=Microbaculum marinum TaxID=1764581 RepID=A0AAW9REK3_9HYPH